MKKSLLALAVAAIAASSTVSATTVYDKDGTSLGVYGRVQSVLYSGNNTGVTDEQASIKTSARFGVDMRTQLTAGTSAFALAEWEASNGNNVVDEQSSDGDGNFFSRLMWVGLDFGQFGSVKVGKFEEAIKYSLFATDFFEDYGGAGYAGNDDRREGVVQYQWSGSGVTALVSYAFAKDNEHLDGAYEATNKEYVDIDYSVSAAVGYRTPDIVFGPIDVRAGYIYGKMNNGDTFNQSTITSIKSNNIIPGITVGSTVSDFAYYDKYSQWALGISWGNMNLGPFVGAQFQKRDLDVKGADFTYDAAGTTVIGYNDVGSADASVTGYEFAFGYSFANGVAIRTAYQTKNYEFDGIDVKAAVVPVFVKWQVNPRFDVWAEARFDAGTDDSQDANGKNFGRDAEGNFAENLYSAGLRYAF